MKEYIGDKEFICLVDKAIKPSEDNLSRWAKVIIASHTMKDIKESKDIVLCMSICSGLLWGALTEFDLSNFEHMVCICQACKFLNITEKDCSQSKELEEIQDYIRQYYTLHTAIS